MGLATAAQGEAFAVDGLVPRRRVAACSMDEVAEAIRGANEAGEAIVIWGGGTRISIGDPPARYDVALDLSELRGIVDHEPGDLTATVRAWTTLAELAAALAPHGQRWPVEVAHPERATVGGTVASAADGPSRYRYLHVRDWIIGARAVLGDGTITHAGGRVVKNATGYDLTRLYSGSYGTLCALVEVSLKLAPAPERTLTLRTEMPDPGYAYFSARELVATHLPLDALAVVMGAPAADRGAATWTGLFGRLAGADAAVRRLRADLEERLPFEEVTAPDVWERIAALPADADTSVRASLPASGRLETYPGSAVWYPGLETIHVLDEQNEDQLSAFRVLVEQRGGAVVIERAPLELKRALGAWGTPRLPAAVARGLKARFDPRAVLAPGRMPFS